MRAARSSAKSFCTASGIRRRRRSACGCCPSTRATVMPPRRSPRTRRMRSESSNSTAWRRNTSRKTRVRARRSSARECAVPARTKPISTIIRRQPCKNGTPLSSPQNVPKETERGVFSVIGGKTPSARPPDI